MDLQDMFQNLQWGTFAPYIFINMLIPALFGLIGGWLSHRFATKRDNVNWNRHRLVTLQSERSQLVMQRNITKREVLDFVPSDLYNHDYPPNVLRYIDLPEDEYDRVTVLRHFQNAGGFGGQGETNVRIENRISDVRSLNRRIRELDGDIHALESAMQ